ncbi:MAG: LysR family transcriptional regulator [Alphaproteobacteria bacterium]|nr:LysR family transcriptional regulator [Alphaproteobacteria bacterium]
MKSTMVPGLVREIEVIVDDSRAISFMGDDLRVYATPSIVSDLEYACRDFILEHLDAGQDTVGARVEIEHLKPTPMGMAARLVIKVEEVKGRSVTCSIEVHDAVERVATARHMRFVVDVDRLRKAVAQKRAQMT